MVHPTPNLNFVFWILLGRGMDGTAVADQLILQRKWSWSLIILFPLDLNFTQHCNSTWLVTLETNQSTRLTKYNLAEMEKRKSCPKDPGGFFGTILLGVNMMAEWTHTTCISCLHHKFNMKCFGQPLFISLGHWFYGNTKRYYNIGKQTEWEKLDSFPWNKCNMDYHNLAPGPDVSVNVA